MYSDMLGIVAANPPAGHKNRLLGRVAKKCREKRQTFLQTNPAAGIDTFRVSMLKYIEKNGKEKETGA